MNVVVITLIAMLSIYFLFVVILSTTLKQCWQRPTLTTNDTDVYTPVIKPRLRRGFFYPLYPLLITAMFINFFYQVHLHRHPLYIFAP